MRDYSYRHKEDDVKIDMTPMLDIVFIMLIFFIVTASFLKESGIHISVPENATKVTTEKVSIVIEISDNDDIWFAKRRIDVRAVGPNLKRRMSQLEDSSVVIRTHPNASTGIMMQVVDNVRQADVLNFVVIPMKE
ncbi:ExbD/TolR family protein [Paremcibacter congregatus]|uniref:Biopolymer transporter ExbD n=1 Tax=Paremcibacter congregatus TaxID=2043170 RepID=A0A2G4YT62_9PROT|nr:biopolymer transporter ExbD [Paremcibacter congregatus]PHZ85519.1 biopolymer transporter ExbD [Paremcibacter congregatus]QDE26477.1 biopolymer transporter ExbD [Paremcibacter congregatus]